MHVAFIVVVAVSGIWALLRLSGPFRHAVAITSPAALQQAAAGSERREQMLTAELLNGAISPTEYRQAIESIVTTEALFRVPTHRVHQAV